MTVKTELEWAYEPPDYFEASLDIGFPDGILAIGQGQATFTLATPANPLPADLRSRLIEQVEQVFSVRRLITTSSYTLAGPRVVQHEADGRRSVSISLGGVSAALSMGKADFVVTAADGSVKFDSRKQRIAEESAMVLDLAPKALCSTTLRTMLDSYGRSVTDPANALVHLYEIRDAASKHYGGEGKALAALRDITAEWRELGRLANDARIAEGRHRGKQLAGLRHAMPDELAAARRNARAILERFAASVVA